MLKTMLEAVPNVSEGRDAKILDALSTACARSLLDRHEDVDHNRSVFTLAGPGPRGAEGAVRLLAKAVAARVDISGHKGVHPRLGALDVVPFVALGPTTAEQARAKDAAHSFARWWSSAFDVPCFMYDEAHEDARALPDVRRQAFRILPPDYGPATPHPRLGATAISSRRPLIAINCILLSDDVQISNRIARTMRKSEGGLPGVRALSFHLNQIQRTQVSMNLFNLNKTGLEEAVLEVRALAIAERTDVAEVELVGLIPRFELDRCTSEFVRWSGIDVECTIEARIEHNARGPAPKAENATDGPITP